MKRALLAIITTIAGLAAALGFRAAPATFLDAASSSSSDTTSTEPVKNADGSTTFTVNGQTVTEQANGTLVGADGAVVTDPALTAAATSAIQQQHDNPAGTTSTSPGSPNSPGSPGSPESPTSTGGPTPTNPGQPTSTTPGSTATTSGPGPTPTTGAPGPTPTTGAPGGGGATTTTAKPATTTTAAPATTTTAAPTTTTAAPVSKSSSKAVVSPGTGTITVTVTISGGRVTACNSTVAGAQGDSTSYSSSSNLASLCSKAVSTNAASVSKSGGATLTTNAFNSALAAARAAGGI